MENLGNQLKNLPELHHVTLEVGMPGIHGSLAGSVGCIGHRISVQHSEKNTK